MLLIGYTYTQHTNRVFLRFFVIACMSIFSLTEKSLRFALPCYMEQKLLSYLQEDSFEMQKVF